MSLSNKTNHKWWKEATGYQVYPASFKDTNEDGIGDLNGITESLDYLKNLGVDFLWLSPVYDSPGHDVGYDVRNYEKIWSRYGTMEDMHRLISEAKSRDLRILMDLVINHTSHEHHWFQESKKSKSNKYSDWYIWRDPKYTESGERKAPCNWQGVFGGSTWTYVPERDQYYLHLSLSEQPDLNWENPETRKAIYASAIEFWLAKGVDGFRVDMVNAYWKEPTFPDAPVLIPGSELQPLKLEYVLNGPKVHDWLHEQRTQVLDRFGQDIVTIGELPATEQDEVLKYVSASRRELDATIDFNLFIAGNHWSVKMHDMKRHTLPDLKDAISKTQGLLHGTDAWTTAFLENHDNARSVSHFGPGEREHMEAAAKMLALFVTTLSGTLIMYQGQEIGMTNVPQDSSWKLEDFKDEVVLRYFREIEDQYPGDAAMKEKAYRAALTRGRDNSRTPMQWSAETHGGFTKGKVEPWIRVNPNYPRINVAAQLGHEDSVLEFWRKAVAVRKEFKEIFVHGDFRIVDQVNETVFAFWKESGAQAAVVLLNFSDSCSPMPKEMSDLPLELVLSTTHINAQQVTSPLNPWEGRVFLKTNVDRT